MTEVTLLSVVTVVTDEREVTVVTVVELVTVVTEEREVMEVTLVTLVTLVKLVTVFTKVAVENSECSANRESSHCSESSWKNSVVEKISC